MSDECAHAAAIRDVTPSALGCEECLKIGSPWLHLRLCRTCGNVGCCDDSPYRFHLAAFARSDAPFLMVGRVSKAPPSTDTPSLRLLADGTAEALLGLSQTLDGLTLLADPAHAVPRRRRA